MSPWLCLIYVPAIVACIHEAWRDRNLTPEERKERSLRSDRIWEAW